MQTELSSAVAKRSGGKYFGSKSDGICGARLGVISFNEIPNTNDAALIVKDSVCGKVVSLSQIA